MKLNKLKSNVGFTLIELIIALSIISIISMVFFRTINSSIKYNTKNEKDIKALNIAQTEIEDIRNEIKNSEDTITINNEFEISITDNSSDWIEREIDEDGTDNVTIEVLNINNDENILQYEKSIPEENINYTVYLNLSRQKKVKEKLYLYNINVEVKPNNENISKKTTTLTTSVLSK